MRPSIGAVLEDCEPEKLDGNNLILKTSGGSGFSIKMVERGIPMIEKIIADEMKSSIKINFMNEGVDAKSTNNKPEIHPNDNKLFNKVVDVFDGEILR